MTRLVLIVGILLIVFLMGYTIRYSPTELRTDYTTKISVDKPDKIESAISNAVSGLVKRDFVPVNLEVKWYPAIKTYEIYAGGIDRTHFGKYKP